MTKFNKTTLFLFMILLFLKFSYATCQKDIHINYDVSALDQYNYDSKSEYDYPNFREDDYLIIDHIRIENRANCSFPQSFLTMILISPSGKSDNICTLNIPKIQAGDRYILDLPNLIEKNPNYQLGKKYSCIHTLNENGEFGVKMDLEEIYDAHLSGSIGLNLIHDNKANIGNKFKVYSKNELYMIDLTKKSIKMTFIVSILSVIVGAFLGLLIEEYIQRKKWEKKKKEAIKSLIYEINKNIEFANEIVNKKNHLRRNNSILLGNFITLNIERVILKGYIRESILSRELLDYYESLLLINNFIMRIRFSNTQEDLNKIIKMLGDNNNIKIAKNLIKNLSIETKICNLEHTAPMIVEKNELNKKEKIMLLVGLIFGLLGGYISNIAVTAMYRIVDKQYMPSNIFAFVLGTTFIFGVSMWILNILKNDFS